MSTIQQKSWAEFRDAGFLWWVNRGLHVFGWAIVYVFEGDGTITQVDPARVRFRGFDLATEAEGFQKISSFLEENAGEIAKEARE